MSGDTSAENTIDALANKRSSGKENQGIRGLNSSVVTSSKSAEKIEISTESLRNQAPSNRLDAAGYSNVGFVNKSAAEFVEKNEFRGLSVKNRSENEIDAQTIKLSSGKVNLGIDEINNSALTPSKSSESVRNHVSPSRLDTVGYNDGISENKSAAELGGKYESRGLSGKNGIENEIKTPVESLVNNEKITTKIDAQKPIQASQNLSEKNTDSHINVMKNESVESADHELISIIQQEKSPVLNRAETLPKPVLVSNFNSEIRETIVGQLTKVVNGVTKFKVALYPENFGKISIEISYSENAGLKINMIGDSPEATRILEQNLPSLRDNLQNEKLSELVVNLNSNRDSQGFGNKNNKSENENSGDGVKNDPASVELVESDSKSRQENISVGSGDGLDTYV